MSSFQVSYRLQLLKLNVSQLMKLCRSKKLSTDGTKKQLTDRLLKYALKKEKKKLDKKKKKKKTKKQKKQVIREKWEIILYGFIRISYKNKYLLIPKDIIGIIKLFVLIKLLKIYGIARNNYNELCLNISFKINRRGKYVQKGTELNGYKLLQSLSDIVFVASNIHVNSNSLIIQSFRSQNELFISGNSEYRERSSNKLRTKPYKIEISNSVVCVSKGLNNGKNTFIYSEGNILYDSSLNSTNISFLSKGDSITDIRCNKSFSVFLTKFGKVYKYDKSKKSELIRFRNNKKNQKNKTKIINIAVGDNDEILCVTKKYNLIHIDDDNDNKPYVNKYFKYKNISIIRVEAGLYHFIVVDKQRFCYSFGNNDEGQCGNNKRIITPNWSLLVAGFCHKHFIDHDVYSSMINLIVSFVEQNIETTDISLTNPHQIRYLGNDKVAVEGQYIKVDDIGCGAYHTVLLSSEINTQIYTFGNNTYGQCKMKYKKKESQVIKPWKFCKKREIGIPEHSLCTNVIALYWGTLIIIQ